MPVDKFIEVCLKEIAKEIERVASEKREAIIQRYLDWLYETDCVVPEI
jgi:hypothetical protein